MESRPKITSGPARKGFRYWRRARDSSYALAKDGWRVTALEPDKSEVVGAGAIQYLGRATGTNIQVVTNWGEELPFASSEFDLVYCRAVLHHARDLQKLCREAARVLVAGAFCGDT